MAEPSGAVTVEERIASLSVAEFRRHLPLALKGRAFAWTGALEAHLLEGGVEVAIRAEPLLPLALSASLALPRLRITLTFRGGGQAERDAFTQSFDRAFQRGGG